MYDTIKITKRIEQNRIHLENWRYSLVSPINGTLLNASTQVPNPNYLLSPNPTYVDLHYHRYYGLSITFHIPTFLYGSGFYEFKLEDKNELIDSLREILNPYININVMTFNVSRLDLCKNLEVDNPSSQIATSLFLLSKPKVDFLEKRGYENAISFIGKRETFTIYDKQVNDEKKNYEIPAEFVNRNIIRFENQIKKTDAFTPPCRYGQILLFRDIFKKKTIKRSKEILLNRFKECFGKCYIEQDIIALAREIKNNIENNSNDIKKRPNLIHELISVLAFQKGIIHLDDISRVSDCFYTSRHSKRIKNDLKEKFEFSIENQIKNGAYSLYEKLKKELWIRK